MGVFSRFSRKSKATAAVTAEASTEEAAVNTPTADSPVESGVAAPENEAAEATEADGVDIPKQQSAEEAADNEAGEGARK